MSSKLILASQSPRRAELLSQIGVSFIQRPAEVDETPRDDEPPLEYVWRMAELKAKAVCELVQSEELAQQFDKLVVLGADTIGEISGEVLVKPHDFADFKRMMEMLSNNVHFVHTAVALCHGGRVESRVVTAEVEFGPLSDQDIHWYWQTEEPKDKAGGYAIQGIAGHFVKQIKGSYSAVVGLPLYETVNMLKQAGISLHEC